MNDYIFSHYEVCHDNTGWQFIKAWYVHPNTGDRKYLIEQ